MRAPLYQTGVHILCLTFGRYWQICNDLTEIPYRVISQSLVLCTLLVTSVKWWPSTVLHGVFQFLIQSTSLHLFIVSHVDYHWEVSTDFSHFCWLHWLFFILSHICIWFTLLATMDSSWLPFVQLICSWNQFFPVWSCEWNFFCCLQYSFSAFWSTSLVARNSFSRVYVIMSLFLFKFRRLLGLQ